LDFKGGGSLVWFSKIQDAINKIWGNISKNIDDKVSNVHESIKDILSNTNDILDNTNKMLSKMKLITEIGYNYDNTATTSVLKQFYNGNSPDNGSWVLLLSANNSCTIKYVDNDASGLLNGGNSLDANVIYTFAIPTYKDNPLVLWVNIPASTNLLLGGSLYFVKDVAILKT